MPETEIVSDANVALKWFHHAGEEDVDSAVELLDRHRDGRVVIHVLDLTFYEVGDALLRGRAHATPAQTATVLAALRDICATIVPDDADLERAAGLAVEHDVTLYDATYAAVAERRPAPLATFDRQLLAAGLGARPADLLGHLDRGDG